MRTAKYGVVDTGKAHFTYEGLWWQYISAAEGFGRFEIYELKPDSLFDTEAEARAFARDIVEWPYDDVAYVAKVYSDGEVEIIAGIKSKHGPLKFNRCDAELKSAVVYSNN
jgi:hypothetical protein